MKKHEILSLSGKCVFHGVLRGSLYQEPIVSQQRHHLGTRDQIQHRRLRGVSMVCK